MAVSPQANFPNFWRFDLTESAANTYSEQTIDTNLSAERGVIALIDTITIQLPELTTADDEIEVQFIIHDGQTAILDLDDVNMIWKQHYIVQGFSTDAAVVFMEFVKTHNFVNAIPYIAPNLTLGIQGTSLAAAGRVRGRVGYRLKKVTQSQYLALLSSLTR